MGTILLTHIPKTASTSMRRAVFDPVIAESDRRRFTGVWNALSSSESFRLLKGHYPYGVHHLYGIRDHRYFVMLRDPVERAVSHFHFIRACEGPSYVHPDIEDARRNDLAEFFLKPWYQNMQTRFVAGLGWEHAGRHIRLNGRLGRWALSRAKQNLLEQYEAFGLKERFRESAQLFASRLNASADIPEKKYKETPDRPQIAELHDDVVQRLRQCNVLDVQLYQFAAEHFGAQCWAASTISS